MVKIRYFFFVIYTFIVATALRMTKTTEQLSTLWFWGLQIFYVIFYGGLIVILENRKKLLVDRRFSTVEMGVNTFLLNVLLSTEMIWCVQLLEERNAFDSLTSLFDALYFSVITFVTVGYGDIKPITPLAKIICIEVAVSNLLILVVFMNYFIAKASIKKNYKMDCILHIVFMIEHMTSRIQLSDKSLKGIQKTWPEWGNELIRILRKNLEENPSRVNKLKQRIDAAKEQNSKRALSEPAVDLTGIYINDTELFLLGGLYDDMNEFVIPAIREVLRNRAFLIENENITEEECRILQMFEEGFSSVVTAVSYSGDRSLDLLKAVFEDLQKDLSNLGYPSVNKLPYGKSGDNILGKAVINEHRHISILDDIISLFKKVMKRAC